MEDKRTEEEYLNAMFDLFSQKGWKYLIEDTSKNVDTLKELLTKPSLTNEEFRLIQGRVIAMTDLIGLKPLLENYVENKKQERPEGVNE